MHLEFERSETITPAAGPEIVFRQFGQGEPLFLFHGGSGSYRHWMRNLAPLGTRFSLHVPDLPGFGDSGDVPPDISLDAYVGLVTEAVERIAPREEGLHIAGFSFGGMIGAGVAARLLPRMRRLSVLAPGGMGRPEPHAPAVELLKVQPGMDDAEISAVYRNNVTAMMIADPANVDEDAVTLHRASIERARFRNWGLSWTDSLVGYLAEMKFPVQLMYGENDLLARPTVTHRVERCRTAKPDLAVQIISGAGHWVQYEAADEVNEHLIGFHAAAG
jgi:pimeloyl-ACP methyl ester carboxylesterase